ncbi:divergent PAP2 family protein [Selenomonas sp. AE3005]|uniref:divergent PAP2 family protein n=1 Tax=Selenomonas sp. AE3005 TaxID=1485543 RepID=UPI00048771F9|nr:divergent PAP2 family protein [Selenomonas sp. AE3005]
MIYVLIPFLSWCIAGCLKFVINCLRFGRKAKSMIGYGGFPSTHTTIMSSVVFFAGFKEGFTTPLFSIGLGALLVLVIDAHGLRRKVGEQAKILNELQDDIALRESMGHSWGEIFGGLILGIAIAYWSSILSGEI